MVEGAEMVQIQLTQEELAGLTEVIDRATRAQELRRALAILWINQGEGVQAVADRLRVSRTSVYNWLSRFEQRSGLDLLARLTDAARSGRPRTALGVIDPFIAEVIDTDPRALGYRQTVWTAELLMFHLMRAHDVEVSIQSVRRAVERLGIGWKRPRHELALKARHWRQAKGGSNVASKAGRAPSS